MSKYEKIGILAFVMFCVIGFIDDYMKYGFIDALFQSFYFFSIILIPVGFISFLNRKLNLFEQIKKLIEDD